MTISPKVRQGQGKSARSLKIPKGELDKRIAALKGFSTGMLVLTEDSPDRMTMGQMFFFIIAAMRDMQGDPTTYTEIKEGFDDVVNKSLHSTYRQLLKPSRTFPKAIGWLDRWEDPVDNRRKLLTLTPKGRRVIQLLLATLGDFKCTSKPSAAFGSP